MKLDKKTCIERGGRWEDDYCIHPMMNKIIGEDKWIDIWTIFHIILAFIIGIFTYTFIIYIPILIILSIEIIEHIILGYSQVNGMKFYEYKTNLVMDIIIGIIFIIIGRFYAISII